MTVLARDPVVASFGGGLNSTAMLVELVGRGDPVDAILFADTGGELPETYAHVDYFSSWLVSRGYPPITVVRHTLRDGTFQSLEDECLAKATLPSIAFGFKKCSGKFKIEPQDKWVNHWLPALEAWRRRSRVVKLIGFGVDEQRRVDRGNAWQSESWYRAYASGSSIADIAMSVVGSTRLRPSEDDVMRYGSRWDALSALAQLALRNQARRVRESVRFAKRYPLVQFGMDRAACLESLRRSGVDPPVKSSCFFCPSRKKAEVLALPVQLQRRGVAMEDRARPSLQSVAGLGRSFSWRDLIDGSAAAVAGPAPGPAELPCDCTDGGDDDDE